MRRVAIVLFAIALLCAGFSILFEEMFGAASNAE